MIFSIFKWTTPCEHSKQACSWAFYIFNLRHPPPIYRDFDDVLHTPGGGRGSDLTRGGEVHEIIRENDHRIIYRVTVDVLDWDTLKEVIDYVVYDFILTLVDGRWLFLNFNLTS